MAKILVICAHPDDETLGLGGTLALHSKQGDKISVLIFADGESSRGRNQKMISRRQEQAKKACKMLGISKLEFLNYKDQKLDTIPILELAQKIEKSISSWNPSIVYTHYWGDVNQDHRRVFEATQIATRPIPSTKIKQVICYETPSSTEWGLINQFKPNYYVNIDKILKRKIKAASCYTGEIKKSPHPRSLDSISIRAQYWGSSVGLPFAEAFLKIREIK